MGNGLSNEAKQFFTDMVSSEVPPDEKVFAEYLARFKKDLCSGSELFHFAIPVLRELIQCTTFHRVRWLLQFCHKQLEHFSCNYNQGHNDVLLASLHILEFVVRYAQRVSCGKTAELRRILGDDVESTADSLSPPPTSTNEANKFCVALMEYCVRVPVLPSTIEAHGEVTSLLLSMTSSALFHSTTTDEEYIDFFTEIMMTSECFPAFFAVLLDRLVAWGTGRLPDAPVLYLNGNRPSLRNMYNVFGSNKSQKSIGCGDHLGRHSAQLLSTLVAHHKGFAGPTPALEYMMNIQEDDRLKFGLLLSAITNRLQECPALCMVLYTLVYDHHTFLHTVMTAHSKELLDVIQEILHLSYKASTESSRDGTGSDGDSCGVMLMEEEFQDSDLARLMKSAVSFSYPFINFMTSTLVLLFSQDQVLNKLMNDTVVTPRFKIARHMGALALSSICIIVLTHGICRALNEENEPLAAVFIPSLSNLSPFIRNIDAFTSQRLMRLLILTKRKLLRAAEQGKVGSEAVVDNITSDSKTVESENTSKNQGIVDMFLRQLCALTEAIEGMLQGEDRQNDALIYELLYYRSEIFDDITAASPLPHVTAAHKELLPLFRIVEFYETEIASVTSVGSYQDILSVVRRVTKEQGGVSPKANSPSSSAMLQVELKSREILFVYEESPDSYDFFGPFVWATFLSDAENPGGLYWTANPNSLKMFLK